MCQDAKMLNPAHSSCWGHHCRTEHKPAAHQQDTREAVQGLWSHRSAACSLHLQPFSSGGPTSEIRDMGIGKCVMDYGISSLQIKLVAPYESPMLPSSIRKTCAPLVLGKLVSWHITWLVSNELHASCCVISKIPQETLEQHECSGLSRCIHRSQKQPHHHATQYSGGDEAVLLHLRNGSQHAAKNTSCLQELSGKSKCNSLWYPSTWLGEDPGSYLSPGSFPLLLLEL